jgi:hypothetical protein
MTQTHDGQNGDHPPPHQPDPPAPLEGLKRALKAYQSWPSVYVFKFIVPSAELNHLLALLDGLPYTTRSSSSGRYVSVTIEVEMPCADDVIAVYLRTAGIKGLVSL